MKPDVRKKRDKLLYESLKLRELASDNSGTKSFDIRKQQDEVYKRWEFYDKLLKAEKERG